MRFDKIDAPAFGPLNDALELAPGMNVIYGPNEAGKSSWHAALYAGLCGMRRAQGNSRDIREFTERHKPWDSAGWEVNAVITLADGRRVELRHDLANKLSSARDANIAGRDYANEILFEGAPDGSRWLGLNRRTFLSTACVRQADILGILDSPATLQDDMQQAAATAREDGTAAAALRRLNDFLRDEVGTSRAPTKPLRRSENAVRKARNDLDAAGQQHVEYFNRRQEVDRLEHATRDLQSEVAAMDAALADDEAQTALDRLERIRELHGKFPEGAPHPSPERDTLVEQATTALEAWNSRPEPIEPDGLTVEALTRQIEDTERELAAKRAAVAEREAEDAVNRYRCALELSGLFPDGPPRTSVREDQLAERARAAVKNVESLPNPREPVGRSAAEIREELTAFDARTSAAQSASMGGKFPLLIASALAIAAGIIVTLAFRDFVIAGVAIAVIGVTGGIVVLLVARPRPQDQLVIETTRRNIEQRLEVRLQDERRYEDERRQRDDALSSLYAVAGDCGTVTSDQGLAVQALHDWLRARDARLRQHEKLSGQWDELQGLLGGRSLSEIETAAGQAEDEAARLIAPIGENLLSVARAENITREQLVRLESRVKERRIEWERQRVERSNADKQFQEDRAKVNAAHARLRAAAAAVGAEVDKPTVAVATLDEWLQRRTQSVDEANERMHQWDALQQMLGEQSLEEMEKEGARLQREAVALVSGVDEEMLARARAQLPTREKRSELVRKAEEALSRQTKAEGELAEFARGLPSVADAEEALADAEHTLERIHKLHSTLNRTIEFLEDAQERVHRDIAPILRRTVLEWLPDVTEGRYVDCQVDPESLAVELSGADGRPRNAALLSRGTAEQVYLLLRLALAQHLTRKEPCPLILDDAVAACDAQRKQAILDTLLAITKSSGVQVILFTHEEDVRDWACNRLTSPNHLLKELERAPIVP